MATGTEVRSAWRALRWPLLACVVAGCPAGQDLQAEQDALRDELQMLRARLARLEADTAEQHRRIQRLTEREEKLAAEAEPVPAEKLAVGRPMDSAVGRSGAGTDEEGVEGGPSPRQRGSGPSGGQAASAGQNSGPDRVNSPRPDRATVAANEFTRRVQQALTLADYDPGPIDGRAGAKTKKAIRKFQRDNNLPETGVADEATWDLLKRYRK